MNKHMKDHSVLMDCIIDLVMLVVHAILFTENNTLCIHYVHCFGYIYNIYNVERRIHNFS